MITFKDFADAVTTRFEEIKHLPLYRVTVDKDELWDHYLASFPEGTNPIFRERTEHDCSACKAFIRAAGGIVANDSGRLISIWGVDIGEPYRSVADAMSEFVLSKPINNFFLHDTKKIGIKQNFEELEDRTIQIWNHLNITVPPELVFGRDIDARLGKTKAVHDVFKRSLEEISLEAIDTVLELIDTDSLYRGEEHRRSVVAFRSKKLLYGQARNQELFCWQADALPIRNTVIGTLLVDLSEGKELEASVKSFEAKVAPDNYKRPKSLVTKGMIEKAEKKVVELGFLDSLPRRYAVAEDVTVANVLFADRTAKRRMGVFDTMIAEAKTPVAGDPTEIGITEFVMDILPRAENISMAMERRLESNQVSLIAPVDKAAPSMLKWNNNFSWVYAGEVADSMKQRVKAAGGKVDGVIRFSLQWNDGDNNQNDFDAHCIEPNGNLISYPKAGRECPSSGILDVDNTRPGNAIAVENITWSDESAMGHGQYQFIVHNYSSRTSPHGFTAEIEYDGHVWSYTYDKPLRGDAKIKVANCQFDGKSLKVTGGLPIHDQTSAASREAKVSMVMYSPNHWDGQGVGNRHYFFMLDGVKREGEARGFFNEFLQDSLNEHRKVFEILGSKMRAPATEDQITGIGFSSTQRNHFNVKVDGRPYKVTV